MNTISKNLFATLMGVVLLSSCSRPVAYFQKSQRETYVVKVDAPVVTPAETPVGTVTEPIAPAEISAVQADKATAALDQLDAMVRNDSKLATDKSVQKRVNRVKALLATATQKNALTTAPEQPQKMNLVQRLMVKKMNKRINKQLAPENPNKPMANKTILVAGAVVLLVGLLILVLGTSSALSSILLGAGIVILLVGLLTGS